MSPSARPPHLLHVFSTFAAGGPEVRTIRLIATFGEEFRHSILAMDGCLDAAQALPPGAPVQILPSLPKRGSLRTAVRLRPVLDDVRPDLILTYNWGAFDVLLAARAAERRRLIHHEEGFNRDEAVRFKRRRVLARRFVLPRVYRVVVPSQTLLELATRLWRLPRRLLTFIPNGVRLADYPAADGNSRLRSELGIPPAAPVVGAVGALRPVKNLGRLIDAVAKLDGRLGAHLLIVGDGSERPALAARAASRGLASRVHFSGYQEVVAPWLQCLDLYALTSDSEQLPVSLLEAMAARLPAVATAVGDVAAMLPPEQHPYLVDLEDTDPVDRLTVVMTRLLEDQPLRRRLGELNRQRVAKRFSFASTTADYRDLYYSCLLDGAPGWEATGAGRQA